MSHRLVDIPINYTTFLDVDEDGVVDFWTDPHSRGGLLRLTGGSSPNGFLDATLLGLPTLLSAGDVVGPAGTYLDTMTIYAISFGGGWGYGGDYSLPPGNHLVGVQFERRGATHYGWLGLVVTGSPPWIAATITEISWESEPGTAIIAGWGDCNGNGLNDVFEILSGADLPDCNGDLIDDDCQPDEDCNGNGIRDLCELGTPGVADCNDNLVPDACDVAADPALDCDGDGSLDACALAADPALDCDSNGVLDSCQGVYDDCDGNGVSDGCEIAYHPERDCDFDGVLDVCQIPGDPTLDCDGNGVFDTCEIAQDSWLDCDGDGQLDACAIAAGLVADCDGDGVPDSCQGTPFADDPSCMVLSGGGAGAVIPGLGNVIPSSEITIEFWQWISEPGPQPALWTDGDGIAGCNVYYFDGRVHWEFGSEYSPDALLDYVPPVPIEGSWQHFAVQSSIAGQFMRIYRNGVLEAEKSSADAFISMGQLMHVGVAFWSHPMGKIDELRIWSHVRTPAEIQQFMGGTVELGTRGLVGYWRFDEGGGSVAKDLAGAHDAQLNEAARWGTSLNCPRSPDLNGDGIVDGSDLGILLGAWGAALPGEVSDLNADGVVDGADLGALLSHWG